MAQKPQMLEPVPSANAAGGLALVIDDDPMVLLALQTLLEEWGWRVIAAPCLQTAVDRLDEEDASPRLVLSDYRLEGDLTGINVILALRERLSQTVHQCAPDRRHGSRMQGFGRKAWHHSLAQARHTGSPSICSGRCRANIARHCGSSLKTN